MTDAESLLADLEDADARYREYDARIEEYGETSIDAVADAHGRAMALLDQYEGRATGTGDFEAYVRFQGEFEDFVDDLPDDLPHRELFEQANERFDKRRLSESDFEAVRELLAPAGEIGGLLSDRRTARDRYRNVRRDVGHRIRDLEEEISGLERIHELGEADLDAPVGDLREPITEYNETVEEAFETFKHDESARTVIDVIDATDDFPLVEYRSPPADLREYLHTHDAGTKPIPELLEFARYSRSKLDHYVDDVDALKRDVATRETYLERLDATPLELSWPPRPADELRFRVKELVRVLDRFAPPEPIAQLREIRDASLDEEWYERLRTAATAREQLSADERERLADGRIEEELRARRDERDRLAGSLESYPDR